MSVPGATATGTDWVCSRRSSNCQGSRPPNSSRARSRASTCRQAAAMNADRCSPVNLIAAAKISCSLMGAPQIAWGVADGYFHSGSESRQRPMRDFRRRTGKILGVPGMHPRFSLLRHRLPSAGIDPHGWNFKSGCENEQCQARNSRILRSRALAACREPMADE